MTGQNLSRSATNRARLRALAALLMLGWFAAAAGEGLRAVLEPNPIRTNETARLIIEAEGSHAREEPELGPLDEDFERLGTSTSTQIQILNGRQSITTRWVVDLAPRRSGEIEVPPLTLGSLSTPALTLRVLEAPASHADAKSDIFIESEVFPESPYVQSQITYALRLFRTVEILDGTLDEPRASDVLVQRLGRDRSYTSTRGGRAYRVIERRYAIFPQSSGELHIPPVRFDGEVADLESASSSITRLFTPGRRVRLSTEGYRLDVRPRPPEFEGKTWLPGRTLGLVEQWSEDPPELQVGDPLTRTIIVKTTGLRGDQLPEIQIGAPDGVRVYPDQPTIRTASDVDFVYGSREQRFALVPLREGEVTIPEVRVRWWDTAADAPATALIPSRVLTADPAPAEAAGLLDALSPPVSTADAESYLLADGGATMSRSGWRWVSLALFAFWAATALGWWRSRRGVRETAPEDAQAPAMARARRALDAACAGARAEDARDAVLEWAAAAWPETPPRSLGEAARRLGPRLAARVRELDRHLYARGEASWNGQALRREAKSGLQRAARSKRATAVPGLPPLYPEPPVGSVQRSSG